MNSLPSLLFLMLLGMCACSTFGFPSATPGSPCNARGACVRPAAASLVDTGGLKYRSREPPSLSSDAPELAAGNWEGLANKQHWGSTRKEIVSKCGGTLVRYRVVNRTVYADHKHDSQDVLYHHRDAFLEMLLTAIWLYRDFPDVDLWLSTADEPSACSLDLPVLLYSIMDRNTTLAAKSSDVGYVDGVPFSIPHLLTGGPPQQQQRGQPVNFTRGYAIPHGQVWDALGMLPTFLSQNQRYQLEASKARQPLLRPQAIWRGSNTGSLRGWPPASDEVPSPYSDPWAPVLFNKRVHLVRLARNHPVTLDVGLHEVTPELLPEELSGDPKLMLAVQSLLTRQYIPFDDWSMYAVQLSIDGHGVPFRLPRQYLQGRSVIMKMRSPLIDWCEHRFQQGVHYGTFRYDLSDFVDKVHAMLHDYNLNPKKLELMANNSANTAVEVFNFLAQLDSLMYAVLQVKQACPWPVTAPTVLQPLAVSEWNMPRLARTSERHGWRSPTLKAAWAEGIRVSIMTALQKNFPEAAVKQTAKDSRSTNGDVGGKIIQ